MLTALFGENEGATPLEPLLAGMSRWFESQNQEQVMAGRPRTMSNRVRRLLTQARTFHDGLLRVMPREYAAEWYTPEAGNEVGSNWFYARDYSEMLVESLEQLDLSLQARLRRLEEELHGGAEVEEGDDRDRGDQEVTARSPVATELRGGRPQPE